MGVLDYAYEQQVFGLFANLCNAIADHDEAGGLERFTRGAQIAKYALDKANSIIGNLPEGLPKMGPRQHTLPNGRRVILGGRKQPPKMYGLAKFGDAVNVAALPTPPEWNWDAADPAANSQGLGNIEGNDTYGDCTCAGMAHIIDSERATSSTGYKPIQVGQTLWAYSQVTNPPFDIATGQNDNGADEITVLNWWRDHGFFKDGAGKIVGYASVDATNWQEVTTAAWLFDLYAGISLPSEYTQNLSEWDIAGPPNPEEGHCIVSPRSRGYNSKALIMNSWGYEIPMTKAAVAKYLVPDAGGALYAVFTEDSINSSSGKCPNGFDAAALTAYLKDFAP